MAQAPFTIVRPVDNAKVREKVKVLIPKGSIPPAGYIGVFLGGKFLQATVPSLDPSGKYYEYVLDTKGLGLEDTQPGHPMKLEVALYVDYNEQPRIVDRSSVDINIANHANINLGSGRVLRYSFHPGTQMIYNLEQRITEASIDQSQLDAGGKAAELPASAENLRVLYAIDNSYGGGDGLVRIQPLLPHGKEYFIHTFDPAQGPQQITEDDFSAMYMRITSTGRQVFSNLPAYFPPEGSTGAGVVNNVFIRAALPVLPAKKVKPGDSWSTSILRPSPDLDLNNAWNAKTLFVSRPARGEFQSVEWEMDHPCAKIVNTIINPTAAGIKETQTFWFALDTGKVVKIVEDTTETQKETQPGGAPGMTMPGRPGGPSGFGPAGIPGGLPPGATKGGRDGGNAAGRVGPMAPPGSLHQIGPGRGGKFGGPGRPGGGPGMPPGFGGPGRPGGAGMPPGFGRGGMAPSGPGFGNNRMGAPSSNTTVVNQLRIQRVFTLEH